MRGFVGLMVVVGVLLTGAVGAEEGLSCETMGHLAKRSMKDRQNGVPAEEVIRVVHDLEPPLVRHLVLLMVFQAYEWDVETSEWAQDQAVERYGEAWRSTCETMEGRAEWR